MSNNDSPLIVDAFRHHYAQFEAQISSYHETQTDVHKLNVLGEQLEEFVQITEKYPNVFDDSQEWETLKTNLQIMLLDLRTLTRQRIESSHQGHIPVVGRIHTGNRGRPRTWIDPNFLRWAYSQRSTSGISHFLGLGRTTVRQALLDLEIAAPGFDPFPAVEERDELLDPVLNLPEQLPNDITSVQTSAQSPGYLSSITDQQLDELVLRLKAYFSRAGIRMLDGMLRRVGHIVPYERLRLSLLRVDPVHRVFERIRIRRRRYSVPGPNFLWHHDGHHSLIRWGLFIHGFIDGYSRLITGLRASGNNLAQTVLLVFLAAVAIYGIPCRLRGDHGVENVWVAAFMEHVWGVGRGAYIWGRSVHNVRIERLWVDVKVGFTSTWDTYFTELEFRHALDINNRNHIWLLHFLFLPILNQHLTFWAESWNHHRITVRGEPNRSPHDMFGFDMLVCGWRGASLAEHLLSEEELEVFGVDWEGLHDDALLQQMRQNYVGDGSTSWVGRQGPPDQLNGVRALDPENPFTEEQTVWLTRMVEGLPTGADQMSVQMRWIHGLALARQLRSDIF